MHYGKVVDLEEGGGEFLHVHVHVGILLLCMDWHSHASLENPKKLLIIYCSYYCYVVPWSLHVNALLQDYKTFCSCIILSNYQK